MSASLKGFIVVLDQDIREDDAQPTLDAIRMIRGVQAVHPMVADSTDWMARQRVAHEIQMKIYELLEKERA